MKFLDETFLKFNGVPVVQQLSAPLPFVTTRRGDNVIVQRS